MEWLNLSITKLAAPEYRRSSMLERGVWITLLGYCIQQENGGRIAHAKDWTDFECTAVLGVSLNDLQGSHLLWSYDGSDLVVSGYPHEKQREIEARRRAGRKGNRTRWGGEQSATPDNIAPRSHSDPTASGIRIQKGNRKGKENRKEKEKGNTPTAREIYEAYPLHTAPKAAIRAIEQALRSRPAADLMAACQAFAAAVATWPSADRARFVPHPATWFNQGRYDDDPRAWFRGKNVGEGGAPADFDPTRPDAHTGGLPVFEFVPADSAERASP
jgi:hypothetical protein